MFNIKGVTYSMYYSVKYFYGKSSKVSGKKILSEMHLKVISVANADCQKSLNSFLPCLSI